MNEETKAGSQLSTQDVALAEVESALDTLEDTMEEILGAASVERVFGEPVKQNGTVIIPVAEVMSGLGFGGGFGGGPMMKGSKTKRRGMAGESGGAEMAGMEGAMAGAGMQQPAEQTGGGGGGGGRVSARPVAVVVASGDSVRVEPIIDRTKITLSGIIAGGLATIVLLRLFRR